MGRFGSGFGEEGVLAEEIADKQVFFVSVGEVVSCDLLPWAIGDILGEHWLCRGQVLCLGQILHQQMYSATSASMLGQYTASLVCAFIFSIPRWALCRSAGVQSRSYRGTRMRLPLRRRPASINSLSRHPRNVWQSSGPAASNLTIPKGLGGIVCCTPGHVQWNLE